MGADSATGSKVTVLGGGVAGVEALLALHDLAGDRASLSLVAPDPDFVYKPLLVEEPFGLGPPEQRALAPLAEETGAAFTLDRATAVRPDEHTVELSEGGAHEYDYLVIAVGGRFEAAYSGAVTFPSEERITADELLQRAVEQGDGIAFVVPPSVTWSLPLYEIALLTERRARERGMKLGLRLVTSEESPLAVFGPSASSAVRELLEGRGIEVVAATRVHQEDRELLLIPGGGRLDAALMVALPTMTGPAISGLSSDDLGFIPIDEHARVSGVPDVYAAGDGTNFPIKQGGLATQQADAAAAHIAHRLGATADPEPFHPVLRGKLLTGDASLHLRADIAGGGGEGESSLDTLWWPPYKVSGRYLTPWLYHGDAAPMDPEAPEGAIDVEISLPKEWHEQPMSLDPLSMLAMRWEDSAPATKPDREM